MNLVITGKVTISIKKNHVNISHILHAIRIFLKNFNVTQNDK